MEILEEFRRERIDELATMIQKLWRGYFTRQKWNKLHKSQMVISTCWKQWKDKTHIDEMKQLRQEDAAAFVIQKALKKWQVNSFNSFVCNSKPKCWLILSTERY